MKNAIETFKQDIDNANLNVTDKKKKIVVEFSSPNIAKPFHYGHFRSTILGNYISNILEYTGNDVTRINYLGDWGTQFGILAFGYERFGNDKLLKQNPNKHLLHVYVKANELCKDANFNEEGKKRFAILEKGEDEKLVNQWKLFRSLAIKDQFNQYKQLGIQFDVIQTESMFSESAKKKFSEEHSNLSYTDDGAKVFTCVSSDGKSIQIPVLKNDGGTLYISRDVCAAISRKSEFAFDHHYYVVDNSQKKHFDNLKLILKCLYPSIENQITHISYGRVNGMSTRKGTAILLEDIINEAKCMAYKSSLNKETSKVSNQDLDISSLNLGISCLIINDFKKRRTSNYYFNWENAINQKGDSGISLQYSYSRICSLKENSNTTLNLNAEINLKAIENEEALLLLLLLSQFNDIIKLSQERLEPSYIVKYLFDLSKGINKAYKVFQVKNQSDDIAQTRLLLFHCAQNVFGKCMQLIGMTPLKKI